ncbi:MAG: imidazole glycerol phosphate synthase subunit HisH, partial [Angelakisella sp.]
MSNVITVIDYGVGNLFSVQNSLTFLGAQSCLVSQPDQLEAVDALLLPGVGAFRDAMARLVDSGLVEAIRAQAQKKPLLGICLGMQLLFDHGYEFGDTPGLGLIPGSVSKIDAGGQKLPHMGWNELRVVHPSPLSKGVSDGDYVYFVHSYCASTDDRYLCL